MSVIRFAQSARLAVRAPSVGPLRFGSTPGNTD